jgi:hypothetical protein
MSFTTASRNQQGVMKTSKGQVMLPRKLKQVDQISIPTTSRRNIPQRWNDVSTPQAGTKASFVIKATGNTSQNLVRGK